MESHLVFRLLLYYFTHDVQGPQQCFPDRLSSMRDPANAAFHLLPPSLAPENYSAVLPHQSPAPLPDSQALRGSGAGLGLGQRSKEQRKTHSIRRRPSQGSVLP